MNRTKRIKSILKNKKTEIDKNFFSILKKSGKKNSKNRENLCIKEPAIISSPNGPDNCRNPELLDPGLSNPNISNPKKNW